RGLQIRPGRWLGRVLDDRLRLPRALRRRVGAAAVGPVHPAAHELVGVGRDAPQRVEVVGRAELGQERRVADGLAALLRVLEDQALLGATRLPAASTRAAEVAGK